MINYLTKWFGRFGNNIIQLSNALYFSKLNNDKLIIPNHHFFKNNEFDFGNQDNNKNESSFWGINDELCLKNRRDICKNIIYKNFSFIVNVSTSYKNVIHLRGGDQFSPRAHSAYVQAPISYFKKVFEYIDTKDTIIVYEDDTNPIFNILNKTFSIKASNRNLVDDINLILNAENIVFGGVTTFPYSLSLCSQNVKNIYFPFFENTESIYNDKYYTDFKKNYIKVENFIKIGQWRYNSQIKNMLINC